MDTDVDARVNCPRCGSTWIAPIAYGLPPTDLAILEEEGRLHLGGRLVGDGDPTMHCRDCGHEWSDEAAADVMFRALDLPG